MVRKLLSNNVILLAFSILISSCALHTLTFPDTGDDNQNTNTNDNQNSNTNNNNQPPVVRTSVYYIATNDGATGNELYKVDEEKGTTTLVKDINQNGNSNPEIIATVDNILYFSADDGIHGSELWRTDGTAEETYMVKEINETVDPKSGQPAGAGIGFIYQRDGKIYFTAQDGISATNLWVSDGTAEGTKALKEGIAVGSSFEAIGDMAFFTANDVVHGQELWKTDFTTEGTVLVKDIYPGDTSSAPQSYKVGNNILYFAAEDGINGREMWRSDGTEAGTYLIKDVDPGSFGQAGALLQYGDSFLFNGYDSINGAGLYKTNGEPDNAELIKYLYEFGGVLELNDLVYFFSRSGPEDVYKLWKTDGTTAGTVVVAPDANTYDANGARIIGSKILFVGQGDNEFWISDGTSEGTYMLKNINESESSSPQITQELADGRLIFSADDGIHGRENWITDGTTDGTYMLSDDPTNDPEL